MDGFDDLLAPSRNELDENPFEDPFARRHSPDPWASFSHQPIEQEFNDESVYNNGLDQARSTTPTDHSTVDEEPLQAPFPIPHSPSPPVVEVVETPAVVPVPAPPIPSTPERTPSPFKPEPSVLSPLEQRTLPSLDRSFAGLALGGEAVGGWQSDWDTSRPVATVPAQQPEEDDDDDDKPIGQSAKFKAAERDNIVVQESLAIADVKDGKIQPVFVISVDDPQRVGDPIRAFTMYTVHTRTTSPLFNKSSFSVLRRYSDFLWLYETLSMNNPGVVVPPVPGKSPFGRFDDQFVEQRRFALEKCMQKTANHPVLMKDSDLKMFLESDTFALDIKHRKAEISHERGGIMASIGQTLAGPRFYENDEWFDKQRAYLDGLESQLRGLVKSIEIVAKQRAELAVAAGEFSYTISELSASNIGKSLQLSLSAMADVERKAEQLQHTQSQQDIVTLMSTADEYSRLINSVRLAFNSRIRTYTAWQNADVEVRRIKQNHEKSRAQGRTPTDRSHSLGQLAEGERRALDAKHDFDQCSKLIKIEVARFEQERIEDFRDTLQTFLDGMISRQQELIATWENYQAQLLKRVRSSDDKVPATL